MSQTAEFTCERDSGLMRLTINRPGSANAINDVVARGLVEGLAEAMSDDAISAVVLSGAGNRVFCAGRDLKNPFNLERAALDRIRREESIAYNDALLSFDKPLIVAINGAAIGAGLMLALHADQVVAADHALLSLPEIDIGIATMLGHTLVAELAGQAVANDLVLTGRRMTAAEARQRGLVHQVVQASALSDEADACARFLGAKPRPTFRAMKRWILQRRRLAVQAAIAAHAELDAADDSA